MCLAAFVTVTCQTFGTWASTYTLVVRPTGGLDLGERPLAGEVGSRAPADGSVPPRL